MQAIFYNNPDSYPPIMNSARLLVDDGYTVNLICRETREDWGMTYPPGVQLARIPRTGSSLQGYARFITACFGRNRSPSSVFIGHDAHGFLPARLLASAHKRPVIYHCHDFNDRNLPARVGTRTVRAFEQRFARTADLVIVPDEERATFIRRALRLPHPPLVVANAPLSRPLTSGSALRSALANRGYTFERTIFRQGRIGYGHGIENTVRSLPQWKERNWGFVVMGPGDAAYLQKLKDLARALGVEEQFVVLPPVKYDDVADFTAGADLGHALYDPIHVNNVHITTASNKIMEYMAAGVPLLVSDSPSLSAFVERYEIGAAANEDSPESIAAAVNYLLEDPQSLRRMSEMAIQAFDTTFCYRRQFAPVLAAIRSLADRP